VLGDLQEGWAGSGIYIREKNDSRIVTPAFFFFLRKAKKKKKEKYEPPVIGPDHIHGVALVRGTRKLSNVRPQEEDKGVQA
jgi:hypothetical protein